MYYKGNNIGLNYDAATSTWTFNNEPQDFIDTDSFSTADPVFDYTPPPADDEEEEDTNCPEGYIYDNTLKQCVPDPAQNQYMQTATGGGNDQPPVKIAGTDRYTTNNNFQASDEEYENMSAEEFVENYKQRGMVGKNENGNLFIDLSKMSRKGSVLDTIFGRYQNVGKAEAIKKGDIPRPTTEAEASVRKSLKYMFDKNIAHGDLNPNLFNFKPLGMGTVDSENFPLTKLFEKDTENYKIILPTKQSKSNTVSGKTGTEVIGGWGNKVFDTSHGVYERSDDIVPLNKYNETLNKWSKYASLYSNYDTYLKESGVSDIRNKQMIEAEKIKQQQIKTKRENQKLVNELDKMIKDKDEERRKDKLKENEIAMQKKIKKAEAEREIKDFTNLKTGQSTTDSSGDTYTKKDDGGYTFTPSKTSTTTKTYENKRRGGYTGSTAGRGGTSKAKSSPSKPKMTRPNPHTESGFSY